jgi:hypothetical protein
MKRCRPSPGVMYTQSATTSTVLLESRSGNSILEPMKCCAGSKSRPLRVIECTESAMRSSQVVEPAMVQWKVTVVRDRYVSPVPVRSRSTV